MIRRPICAISILYICGVYLQNIFSLSIGFIMGALALFLFMFAINMNKKIYANLSLMIMLILVGMFNYQTVYAYKGQLSPFFHSNIYVIGDVLEVSCKEKFELIVMVREIVKDKVKYKVKEKVIVNLRGEYGKQEIIVGDRMEILGTLYEPPSNRNPKLFNYQLYLKSKRIYSILYGITSDMRILGEGHIFPLLKWASTIRMKIINIILQVLPQTEGQIFLGILLGDKTQLALEMYKHFKEVGAAHILAVSGLHVGILCLFLNRSLRSVPQKIRVWLISIVLCFYIFITGFATSILRATAMAVIWMISPLFDRKYDSISAIFLIAFILLLINPVLLMDVGFQLSFTAVLSVVLFYKPIYSRLKCFPNFLGQMMATSIAAQIGTVPIIAYHFNFISLGAFIVNIPIVMLVGYILPLGFITVIGGMINIYIGAILGKILFLLIKIMEETAIFFASFPYTSIEVVSPNAFSLLLYYSFWFVFIIKDRFFEKICLNRKKAMIVIISLYIFIFSIKNVLPSKARITFVDVGQGDCILIQTPRRQNILIDGGGDIQEENSNFNIGENVVVPYLFKNGIKTIDIMIMSHSHKDHIGGLFSVLDHLKVNTLVMGIDQYDSEDFLMLMKKCRAKNVEIRRMKKDDKIKISNEMNMKILHPDYNLVTLSRDDENNNSLVLLMDYRNKNFLFTGDIEEVAEKTILKNYPSLKVDLLKVPHHGSRFSSSDEFIQQLNPKIAVIQVGKNFFGHPHTEVLNRYKIAGVPLYRNDKNGAVMITIDNDNIKINTMLQNSNN